MVPKRIRTDPGSPFSSEHFRQFCQERFYEHIECHIGDQRGNGKIQCCVCIIIERLRTDKRNVFEEDNTGLSEFVFAISTAKGSKPASSAEQQLSWKHNTVEDLLKPSFASTSEEVPKLRLAH